MKKTFQLLLATLAFSCKPCKIKQKTQESSKQTIATILDNWHKAASEANYNDFFNAMADESVFIGTDATENWNKKDFQTYAKPHFDKGKAWSFKAIERNIYISNDQKTVWFDELLDTQMKICRGSGVLIFENGSWKIKHYVLSMTIPNQISKDVIPLKTAIEDKIILEKRK